MNLTHVEDVRILVESYVVNIGLVRSKRVTGITRVISVIQE